MTQQPYQLQPATVKIIEDFLRTGAIPDDVRPEVLRRLARVFRRMAVPFKPVLTGYMYSAERDGQVLVYTDNLETAKRYGKVKALFLRSVRGGNQ